MKTAPRTAVRLPKNYALVLEIVSEAGKGKHLRTSDVFLEAAKRRPGIGFSTVHRGLNRLVDLGRIARIDVAGSDAVAYEPLAQKHSHFYCTACSAVIDVDYALPARVLRKLAAQSRIQITAESLTLSGRCARCRDRSP